MTTIIDAETGEVLGDDGRMTVYEPRENELALRTDAELVALSEAALEYTIAELDGLELEDAPKTRAKVQALEKLLAGHIREAEARREAARNLTEARIRIERQTGMLIPKMQNAGVLMSQRDKVSRASILMPTLTDYAITRDQSSLWQRMAREPDEKAEEYFARAREDPTVFGDKMGSWHFLSWASGQHEKPPPMSLPEGVYNVIYADPPWSYANWSGEQNPSAFQSAAHTYPTMSTDDICAMPVADHAGEDAVLFLWATSPLLPDALRVMEAWGFEYKACMVWVKNRAPGLGWWVQTYHELLLIGVRGQMPPQGRPKSVVTAPVTEHSRKPDEFYSVIESMYPGGAYLELFARRTRDNWVAFGNEV